MNFNRKYLLAIIPLVITIGIVYYFRDIVSYVIFAWVLSMIGAPIVTVLRKYVGKGTAAGLTLLFFGTILSLFLYLFIPPLVNQARNISKIDYNNVVNAIEEPIKDWEEWLIDKGLMKMQDTSRIDLVQLNENKDDVFESKIYLDSLLNRKDSTYLTNVMINFKIDASNLLDYQKLQLQNTKKDTNEDFFEKLKTNLVYYINPARVQSIFTSTFSAFGNIVIGITSVFFIGFFFLKEHGLFYALAKSLVPVQYESQIAHAIDDSSDLLIRYFVGILIQMVCITLYVAIGLKVLGIENALLIAFFAAITNVIPYLGPIIGASFAVMITLSSNLDGSFYGSTIPQLIKVLGVFASMQLLDNFILSPNIFSKSVKAHPLEIFIVVLVGAKLGGVLGMVLAIPFYTVFRVLAKVFLSEFKVIQMITKNI